MTKQEIIDLGTKLGLPFNEKDNFKDMLDKDIVVFNGCNGQRFLIDGKCSETDIYNNIGRSLVLMGMRMKNLEIRDVLSINGDSNMDF